MVTVMVAVAVEVAGQAGATVSKHSSVVRRGWVRDKCIVASRDLPFYRARELAGAAQV